MRKDLRAGDFVIGEVILDDGLRKEVIAPTTSLDATFKENRFVLVRLNHEYSGMPKLQPARHT